MSVWTILAIVVMASSIVGGAVLFGKQQQKTEDEKIDAKESKKEAQAWADAPHNDDDFAKRMLDRSGKNSS